MSTQQKASAKSKARGASGRKSKKEKVEKPDFSRSSVNAKERRRMEDTLVDYVRRMVDPSVGEAFVAPSSAPGRAGCSHYVQLIEWTGTTSDGRLNIEATPDFTAPLKVSHPDAIPRSALPIAGYRKSVLKPAELILEFTAKQVCEIAPRLIPATERDDVQWIPFSSDVNGTLTFGAVDAGSNMGYNVQILAWDGSTVTVLPGYLSSMSGGGNSNTTNAVPWLSTYTHFGFVIVPVQQGDTGSVEFSWRAAPTAPMVCTCAAAYDPLVYDVMVPEWSRLLEASDQAAVVAQTIMFTYDGPPAFGAGDVAGAVTDRNMAFTDSYSSIAQRPHDSRIALVCGRGKKDDGIHIHWMPSDIRQIELSNSKNAAPSQTMYIGAKGIDPSYSTIKIEAHYIVNYYSKDPSYNMRIQPPLHGFLPLLYYVRKEIPLVSTNSSHLKKLTGLARRAVHIALDNPEILGMAGMLAKALVSAIV